MRPRFADHRAHAEAAWKAALAATDPRGSVKRAWAKAVEGFTHGTPLKLLAVGKASIDMAFAACECIERESASAAIVWRGGIVVAVPERLTDEVQCSLSRWSVEALPADHPLPTHRNLYAAREVESFLKGCSSDETLLVLLSGGGSAHLTSPASGISLAELSALWADLMRSGATIHEINTVRKHIERLKGGHSAAICRAREIRVLVMSDVIGDSLDVIASGPFAADPTTFDDVVRVLTTRLTLGLIPDTVFFKVHMASRRNVGALRETPKPGSCVFDKVTHTIIANNSTALDALARHLRRAGWSIGSATPNIEGESSTVARTWIGRCLSTPLPEPPPTAYLLGGETTVTVGTSTGRGGPSQEFALAGAQALACADLKGRRAALLTFSTDGVDGPTDAAGAVVTESTWSDLVSAGVDAAAALVNHDSHRALDLVGAVIRTGATGTNVNHIAVLFVY